VRHSSVGIVTELRDGQLTKRGSKAAGTRDLSLLQNLQTSSSSVVSVGSSRWGKDSGARSRPVTSI